MRKVSAEEAREAFEPEKGPLAQWLDYAGNILDATMFIPETKRSDETKAQITATGVSNIERWFTTHTTTGNRANHLYRYGMVMIDADMALGSIVEKLEEFNNKLPIPLPEDQFRNSTVKSISKEFQKRSN